MENINIIIKEILAGDKKQFETIINHYQKNLLRYCYYLLNGVSDVEDALQEIFIKIFTNLKDYKEDVSFSAWVYKISLNHCRNILKRKKIIKFIPFSETILSKNLKVDELNSNFENSLLSQDLKLALGKLSVNERSLILLRVIDDLSYNEIAKIIKKSPQTLRKNYERARKKMLAYLEKSKGGVFNEKCADVQ